MSEAIAYRETVDSSVGVRVKIAEIAGTDWPDCTFEIRNGVINHDALFFTSREMRFRSAVRTLETAVPKMREFFIPVGGHIATPKNRDIDVMKRYKEAVNYISGKIDYRGQSIYRERIVDFKELVSITRQELAARNHPIEQLLQQIDKLRNSERLSDAQFRALAFDVISTAFLPQIKSTVNESIKKFKNVPQHLRHF